MDGECNVTMTGEGRKIAATIPQHRRMFLSGRWPPLLYTVFWFVETWSYHSSKKWASFIPFFVIFLVAYLQIFKTRGQTQLIWLGVVFLLGYLYFPFNQSAGGEFVYPVAMSVFFLRQPRVWTAFWRFAAIAMAQGAGVLLETWLLHRSLDRAETIIFYTVAVGLSHFAFSRHVLASEQLEQANREIEHLTQVAERERIARDLHDLLGHTLTVIVLKSDIANRLFTAQPEVAHREITEVEATARKALAEVREAVTGYRAEGLQVEVSRARHALTSAGVQLTTDIEHLVLPPVSANTFCLVLREAITNVVRHSGATVCHLELHRNGELLTLKIEDNGSGKLGIEGNGLRGMRERLAAVGGTLHRESCVEGGTRLTVQLPLTGLELQALAPPLEERNTLFVALDKGTVRA
ncbi:MAG TPA: sensor histidine kinase [Granulicella sp.]|jgi:two-component system sensor histidine kinase DesK